MGGTFGEAARLVQNNFYTAGAPDWPLPYQPASSVVGGIHLSLHGDPTILARVDGDNHSHSSVR
jgi:hypothetical protein